MTGMPATARDVIVAYLRGLDDTEFAELVADARGPDPETVAFLKDLFGPHRREDDQ